MSDKTNIEWADSTFNPWMGCTKVSPACDHCYAERDTKRFGRVEWGAGKPRVRTSPANWKLPERWNREQWQECTACGWRGLEHATHDFCPKCDAEDFKPTQRRVFCASLADVFDNEVPKQWRFDLLNLIASTPNIDWLLLTKRIGNAQAMLDEFIASDGHTGERWEGWPNVWIGATVVNQAEADRDVPKLLAVPARVRFLSVEPMLGAVTIKDGWFTRTCGGRHLPAMRATKLHGIDWIIAGGESGPHARPVHPDWARSLRDQCAAAGVPFLFKQHGEWLATDFCSDEDVMLPSRRTVYVNRDGSYVDGTDGFDFFAGFKETAWVGKKAAGRKLDGIEHNGFPVGQV